MKNTLFAAALVAAVSVNASVIKRQYPTSATLTPQTISGWSSLGCWSDSQKARTLANLVGVGQDISNTQCQQKCSDLGYIYAGNEDGGQCYCDNTINAAAVIEPTSDCNYTCPADQTQPCGALDRMTLFQSGPSQNYNVPGWSFYGCMTDSVGARALTHQIHADNMTPQVCASACAAAGYTLSGVEWTSECYCDNAIQNGQTLASAQNTCNMPCQGDASQACGGSGRLDLFYVNGSPPQAQTYTQHAATLPRGWTSAGCYTDDVHLRALSSYITGPESGMTIEYCVNGCMSAGWTFAGLENGNECYCGSEVDNGQTQTDAGFCSTPCAGDNGEMCGGAGFLNLFQQVREIEFTGRPIFREAVFEREAF